MWVETKVSGLQLCLGVGAGSGVDGSGVALRTDRDLGYLKLEELGNVVENREQDNWQDVDLPHRELVAELKLYIIFVFSCAASL